MNERQKEILQIMYDAADYMTAEAIAEQVEYSVKTIRNDLKQLSVEIAENNIGVLEMKSGKGNRLVISPEEWKELRARLEKASQISTCAQQINDRMCEILLKQKQITVSRLEQIFYCSTQSVEKYLLQAEQWLANYNIKVLRKRGQGIWISSDEYTWRIALWGHFREILAEKFYTNKESSLLMEQYLDGFDTSGVRLAIQRIEEKFGIQFTYDDVQRLLFLVSVAVIKIRKGQTMTERLEEDWEGIAFDRILAENCCDTLQKCYRLKIPKEERRFICLCFGISEIQGFSDMFHKEACRQENSKIMMLAVKSMILVDHIFQSNLRNDIYLLDELFLYLKATICQRKHGIHRENPLLWQIKNKYPNIYAAAWSVSLLVDSEMHVGFGEHEVAYIALYLGGALERQSMEVKACILCNYGLGMAQILRSQIERLDSGLRITDVFSLREKSEIRKNNCDFVISTIPLENPFEGKEVVFVNSILKENDFSNIRKKMEDVSRKKHGVIAGREDSQEYQLFCPQFIFEYKEKIGKVEMLHELCQKLFECGYITKDFEASVLEREKVTSTALGNMVAIPHGMAEHVIRPVIVAAKLKHPIQWDGLEKAEFVFLLALNLKEEFGARRQIAGFYSQLISLLEDESKYKKLKELKGGVEIAGFLNDLVVKR